MTTGARAGVPGFTVLLATYNHARFIRESLESIRSQTSADFHLVLVDDGSTDATPEVIGRWLAEEGAELADRTEVLTQPNGGQSAAWEAGAALCQGRYIALLDSDDRWLPAKLARAAEALAAHPEASLLTHPQWVLTGDGTRTGRLWPRGGILADGDVRAQLRQTARLAVGTASSLVIRTDIFRSLLPPPTRRFRSAADYYFAFGASLAGPVIALPEPLGEYRVHGDSMYLNRMLTGDGLRRQLDLQETITGHFGLGAALPRNAFYQRARFALAALEGTVADRLVGYRRLAAAIMHDPFFRPAQKIEQLWFWGAAGMLPPRAFARLWRWFLLR